MRPDFFARLASQNRPCPVESGPFAEGWAAATMAIVRGDRRMTPPKSAPAEWRRGWMARVDAQ